MSDASDTVQPRTLTRADRPSCLQLYLDRCAWFASRGIQQWRADELDAFARRLDACLAAEAVLGLDGPSGLLALALVPEHSTLWSAHRHPWSEPVRYVEKLMTDPLASPGLGGRFLASVEVRMRALGVACLRMDCIAGSLSLQAFWQARGYVPRAVVRHASGFDVLLHDKRLLPLPADASVLELAHDVLDAPFEAQRATLLFLVDRERVLLIHKKRGHGAGYINGPGGKCEPGETPRACAIREVREEVRVEVTAPEYRGQLRFIDSCGAPMQAFVFVAHGFTGVPEETEEALPEWFALDAVPYRKMWADDLMWLPWVLRGCGVQAAYLVHDGRAEASVIRFGAGEEPGPTPPRAGSRPIAVAAGASEEDGGARVHRSRPPNS